MMEYRLLQGLGLGSGLVLYIVILYLSPTCIRAQTEGDIGYEYGEAYDDYDEESGIEPNFDVPIVNVTVVAGQTAVLPCSIDALGKYKVAWLDQRNMALTFDDRRYVDDYRFSVVRPYHKEWNLQIREVRWEDQGQYKCTINTDPGKSKSVVLHVKVPAQIVDDLSTGDVTVQEGDTVVLVCNVTGVPHPEVTWYRRPATGKIHDRESKMCNKARKGPGIGHVGEVIIIQNVSRYCDDIYECIADNGVPPAVSRQMSVTVEFAPEVTMHNRRIGQDVGKDTILECLITAYPHARNFWEKDGKELTSTSGKYRIQPYDEGQHAITLSLSIHKLSEEDYGRYRCVASNSLGVDSEFMDVFKNSVRKEPTPEQTPPEGAGSEEGTYAHLQPTEPKPIYTVDHGGRKKGYNPANSHNDIKTGELHGGEASSTRSHTTVSFLVPAAVLLVTSAYRSLSTGL